MKLAGYITMSQDSFVKPECFLMFLFLFNHDTEAVELRVKSFREKRVTCVLRVAQAKSLRSKHIKGSQDRYLLGQKHTICKLSG